MRLIDILPPRPVDKPYACAELARRIGKHSNTLRKYETWGFIRPVPRGSNGYRIYDRDHALEAVFAAAVMRTNFKDWRDHRRMKTLLGAVRSGDYDGALSQIRAHRKALKGWLEAALSARSILRSWQRRKKGAGNLKPVSGLSRPQAAARIGVAPDTLRDWERNGLFSPVRLPNGRRRYPPDIMGQIAVIGVLRRAGYSLMGIRSLFHGPNQTAELSHARDRWDATLQTMISDCRLMNEVVCELKKRKSLTPSGR